MAHRILTTIIAAMVCIAVSAQGTCTINGSITDNRLSDGKKVKTVYLTRTNELGQEIEVAKAKVKKGKYTLTHTLAQDEPVLLFTIKGFGEGKGIKLFVEPGVVGVTTASATMPEQSTVSGTPTNDTYAQYQAILTEAAREVSDKVAALAARNGEQWLDTPEGKSAVKRLKAQEAIRTESAVMRFLIDHNSSPMTPLMMEHSLLPSLSEAYADQLVKAVSTTLYGHPYYQSLRNSVLSSTMKVGNEVPNITLHLLGGDNKQLTDLRGRYVILNFWKNGCDKSAELIGELKSLYEVVKPHLDEYVIVSISLDQDAEAWQSAVKSLEIDREGWLHACDGMGMDSPAAKLYKVADTPKTVLIEPEGLAVSLDMETDELLMRIEQILSGDLYYLDQKE